MNDSLSNISNNTINFSGKFGIFLDHTKGVISNNTLKTIGGDKPPENIVSSIIVINDSYGKIIGNNISFAHSHTTSRVIGVAVNESTADIKNNSITNESTANNESFIGMFFANGNKPYVTSRLESNTIYNIPRPYYGDDKTAVTLVTEYDEYKQYFEGALSKISSIESINVNINPPPADWDAAIALKKYKVDYKTINLVNPSLLSGLLVDDLMINDTVLDAGQYVKIDTNINMVVFPKEYRGTKLDEIPLL